MTNTCQFSFRLVYIQDVCECKFMYISGLLHACLVSDILASGESDRPFFFFLTFVCEKNVILILLSFLFFTRCVVCEILKNQVFMGVTDQNKCIFTQKYFDVRIFFRDKKQPQTELIKELSL